MLLHIVHELLRQLRQPIRRVYRLLAELCLTNHRSLLLPHLRQRIILVLVMQIRIAWRRIRKINLLIYLRSAKTTQAITHSSDCYKSPDCPASATHGCHHWLNRLNQIAATFVQQNAQRLGQCRVVCLEAVGYTLIQWFRIAARTTLSPVSDTMTFVGWTGIWQSMQSFTIAWPSLFETPQLCH